MALYTRTNFKSGKALRDAVASGERVTYFQPGPFGPDAPRDGILFFEGPHYPAPHKWWLRAECRDGAIVRVMK